MGFECMSSGIIDVTILNINNCHVNRSVIINAKWKLCVFANYL